MEIEELKTLVKYIEYLAASFRFIKRETGYSLPEGTILLVKSYSPLAGIDYILGLDIYVMDIPSDIEFFIAFKTEGIEEYKRDRIQKAFLEYLNLYEIAEDVY